MDNQPELPPVGDASNNSLAYQSVFANTLSREQQQSPPRKTSNATNENFRSNYDGNNAGIGGEEEEQEYDLERR